MFLGYVSASLVLVCTLQAQATWTQRSSTGGPGPRHSHAMAFDPTADEVVLFGGTNAAGATLRDTWIWDGVRWRQASPATVPLPRAGHAMATLGQGAFLFAGSDPSRVLGDYWTFSRGQWSMQGLQTPPAGRAGHAIASVPGGVLMFGGTDTTGALLNDTWELVSNSGILSWISRSPANAPTPRSGHTMARDPLRNRVVLFGGTNAAAMPRADTWEWDGRDWLRISPPASPSARTGAAMAFDRERARIVMFGGRDGNGTALADTWEWDGRSWRPRSAAPVTARWNHAMARDRLDRIVMFGGIDNSRAPLGDTWLYSESSAAGFTLFGSGCPGTAGIPALTPAADQYPWLGTTLSVEIASIPPTGAVIGVLGLSNARWGAQVLPLDLTQFGLTGCTAYVGPRLATLLSNGGGMATWPIGIPNNPALVGQEFYVQGVVADPGTNPAGLIVSNAGAARIGDAVVTAAEKFLDDNKLDRAHSSGNWSGGIATFGSIGGDGIHGEFTPGLGVFLGTIGNLDTYVIDTNNTVIPGSQTRTGRPIAVRDGRFFFTRMLVPANVRLRFVGASPPVISVRGEIEVLGEIESNGDPVPVLFPQFSPITDNGQPGTPGGAGGGRGGAGGNRADGRGPNPQFDGRPGQDVRLPAGHAFASGAAGTGGGGSPQFPLHGQNGMLTFPQFFSLEVAAGGGGGGAVLAGLAGRVLQNTFNGVAQPAAGPTAGGTAFNPFPVPPGVTTTDHYLIGGSGGGGGGSHALFANTFTPFWMPGGGGSGGGGALALRAGDHLYVDANAIVAARGGAGTEYLDPDLARVPAPGGGGSGGALILQTGRSAEVLGVVDVRGGSGGAINKTPTNRVVIARGGDGSPGFLRFETPGTPTSQALPRAQPPATGLNVGRLGEEDAVVGFQSKWYTSRLRRAPEYLRYEVDARIGGAAMLFSDDPAVGTLARPGTQPIGVLLQGGDLDPVTGEPGPGATAPWRLFAGGFGAASGEPGLVDDGRTGFRFQILLDRSFVQAAVIEEVRVLFR